MSYDMVIETPEALRAWKAEYIRLINAKRQNLPLTIKSVSKPVAESIKRWLRYAETAVVNINNATSKAEMITTYNVVMKDYETLVTNKLTKDAYTTATQSGTKLTGQKTGTPATTKASTGAAVETVITTPAQPLKPSFGGLGLILVAGAAIWLLMR